MTGQMQRVVVVRGPVPLQQIVMMIIGRDRASDLRRAVLDAPAVRRQHRNPGPRTVPDGDAVVLPLLLSRRKVCIAAVVVRIR